jgi:Ran GTPase-activating protein (RanGAP) involved in mRNA processing and transport
MTALYLENNGLTDDSSVELSMMLNEKPKLKKLNLSYNSFSDAGVIRIMSSLEKNTNLALLSISSIGMGVEGA